MSATPLQVYEAIKPKLGEKESQLLLEHIARQTELFTRELATKSDMKDMATKADLVNLRTEIVSIREQMITKVDLEIAAMREQMATREDLAHLRAELLAEMGKLESRLIRWNVGTIIAVAGLTIAISKLLG